MVDDATKKKKKDGGGDPRTPRATIARLREVAREVEDLRLELQGAVPAAEAEGEVSAVALRRLDLLSMMLAQEAKRAVATRGDATDVDVEGGGGSTLAFSTAPLITLDGTSVGFDIPGVGSASVGTDGASAEVDGVGSANIGKDGVSVNVGGAEVTLGGDGARVTIPGVGTVGVGSDGSVSVSPKDDKNPGGVPLPGFPFPPIPCPEACEFKIPIPVPKFVAEPFEIAIGVPQVQTNPVPIPIPVPTPTLTPWSLQLPGFPDVSVTPTPLGPIPIPYPTIGGLLPGVPGPGGAGYNPAIESLVVRLLKLAINDSEDRLRAMVERVADWGDALGQEVARVAIEPRKLTEELIPLWDGVRDHVQLLNDQLASSAGIVTDAVRGLAANLRAQLLRILSRLKELLKAARDIGEEHAERAIGVLADVVNPVGAILTAVRSIYLIVNWVATRIFSVAGFASDLFEEIVEFGTGLNTMLEALE